MPWEKSFDEKEVLKLAMQVFWEKGYEAASIADLLERTGLNRGSLYNAYGGKRKLFTSALLAYDLEYRRAALAQLESLDSPKQAFVMLFDSLVKETIEDEGKKGCFIVNTTLEFSSHDEEAQKIVSQALREFEAFFRRGIEVAQAREEMPVGIDPATTATALLGLVVAIRVLGRGVFLESSLRAIATAAQGLVA